MKTVIVSGVIANKLHNGGAVWTRLSWAVGLARLGYRVVFVEQIALANCVDGNGHPCQFGKSANLRHFQQITRAHGLEASLICDTGEIAGLPLPDLIQAAWQSDFLLNISGHLTCEPIFEKVGHRIYLDVDPGYTQHWFANRHLPHLSNHQTFFTVGLNIGQPNCNIPASEIHWQPILQPVVLSEWPPIEPLARGKLTTIASWRGPFGTIESSGRRLGPKAHEFRRYLDLPKQLPNLQNIELEIALDIGPADQPERDALMAGGWSLVDPQLVAGTPDDFRRYVQQSAAEFSVAQSIYVQTRSGWFSDRSVRYLASGKPAIVQDTGFSDHLPVGAGLLTFTTPSEAAAAIIRMQANYTDHCRAARAVAEKYFDSATVLSAMIARVH